MARDREINTPSALDSLLDPRELAKSPAVPTASKSTPAHTTTAAKPAAAKPSAAASALQTTGQFTVDTFLNALRAQESGGNYTSRSKSSTASGAYQYLDSTWNNYGGYAHAWQAPKAVQDARARADVEAAYKRYGGDWRKVAAAHFAGAGWVAAHPDVASWGVNPVPGSKNPTVSAYVSSLFGKAGAKADVSTGTFDTPQASQGSIDAQIASDFGYMSAFLNDKELGPILKKASAEGWDNARLQGAIYKTRWYKTHADVTRAWDAKTKTDPASVKNEIAAQIAQLSQQLRATGLTIDPKRLSKLAVDSLRFGWNQAQVTAALGAEGKFDTSKPGAAKTTLDSLRANAKQYMVPVSDAALNKWVKDVQLGNLTEQDFTTYLREQAKSLFPGLAAAIDRGVTVEQYADPYRQQAASILEVDPQAIDFMGDPKYSKALFQKDPKTGDNTSMSLADWGSYLRGLPEYGKTRQANQQAAAFGNALATTFGKVAD